MAENTEIIMLSSAHRYFLVYINHEYKDMDCVGMLDFYVTDHDGNVLKSGYCILLLFRTQFQSDGIWFFKNSFCTLLSISCILTCKPTVLPAWAIWLVTELHSLPFCLFCLSNPFFLILCIQTRSNASLFFHLYVICLFFLSPIQSRNLHLWLRCFV